jgi:murein DD-endopeptidase MepM/ murein hydrolase activator NlpD
MPIARTLLFAALALATSNAVAKHAAQKSAPPSKVSVTLNQGEVARWPGIAAKSCVLGAKKYPAVDSVCYFPFDVEARPGRYAIAVIDQDGRKHGAVAIVEKVERPKVDITLPDDSYINVSPENAKRALHERELVLKLFSAKIDPPRFSLPFGAPASPLPKNENDFGSLRTFNGKIESMHTGRDYPINEGSPIKAIADGTVVLAAEHFVTGNSVYIDHGDGMVSASFHMSAMSVNTGDEVKRGQVIGKVGATGRASGAHLHLGIRWLGARVDAQPLLETPLQLHGVGEPPTVAERKEEKAKAEPKESNQSIKRDDEG